METITFTGSFDNGNDIYQVTADIDVNVTELDYAETIVHLVESLERADRKQHGKSCRGHVTEIQIADEEQDRQIDNGNAEIINDELVADEGYEWLNWSISNCEINLAFDELN